MKQTLIFSLALAVAVLLAGCGVVQALFSECPNQYVDVKNVMSGTYINVTGSGVYGSLMFGVKVTEGEGCRVPAALYPESQTLTVIVDAYDIETGAYLGSKSRPYTFSDSRGVHYRNHSWDVERRQLRLSK